MQLSIQSDNHNLHCRFRNGRGECLVRQLLKDQIAPEQLVQNRRISRKGDHVFREGDLCDAVYVVRSGSVKSYMLTEQGEEQVLGFYLPGDVFGLDLSGRQQHLTSAVVLETTSLCRLPLSHLEGNIHGINLLKISAEQMRRDQQLVLMLARKDADGRIAGLLVDLARRYHARGFSALSLQLSMSRQDIACYLGLAVETVSRTLTRFQESGLLKVNRREVEILDQGAICKLAGVCCLEEAAA